MPKQVDVLVKDISVDEYGRPTPTHGTQTTLSYKSFLIINQPDSPRYELLGEVDPTGLNEDGSYKLVPGSPNLNAQHRTALPVSPKPSVAPVVNPGPSEVKKEPEPPKLEETKVKQKPGPKKKAVEGANA